MIYLLVDEQLDEQLIIKGENFKYLVKVRRHSEGDSLLFRSRKNIEELVKYKVISIENRAMNLEKISSVYQRVEARKKLHIAWCVIDPKSVEKVLPSLSEIGVSQISFIFCDRSQKNFKHDLKRFDRILETSMQQSGRTSKIVFDQYKSIKDFLEKFPDTKVFDFSDKTLDDVSDVQRVLIGCEGGFSENERTFLKSFDVCKFDTDLVLRSESAVLAIASKILL